MRDARTTNPTRFLFAGVIAACGLGTAVHAQESGFDNPYDTQPIFNVKTDGPRGDTIFRSADFGDRVPYTKYIFASGVRDFSFRGRPGATRVVAGPDTTTDGIVRHRLGNADGDNGDVSGEDMDAFNDAILRVFQNTNLNNFLDNNGSSPEWSFVIDLERPLVDNEAGPDHVGEILFFERGANTANSFVVIEALDDDDDVIGTPFLVHPDEPVNMRPPAYVGVFRDDLSYADRYQEMGAVSVDLTRLGVASVQHLRVKRATIGENGLTSEMVGAMGRDLNPDFKLLFVETDNVELPAWVIGD